MNRVRTFWSDADQAPLIVLTDFDFTISSVDVGDLVTETFAPPSAETLRRFATKQIGTRLYWLDSMVRADPVQAAELAATITIDPEFAPFAAWCEERSIPLAVVSDGFGFYIERILGREGLSHLPVICNEMERPGELLFPHGNPACDFCACCKAQVARRLRNAGKRVIYIGDGVSDLYAARYADWVFAKGRLERFMKEHGSPYYPLHSFADVYRALSANLPSFMDGSAPRRSTLPADSRCLFTD